jgi:hypothetical protein
MFLATGATRTCSLYTTTDRVGSLHVSMAIQISSYHTHHGAETNIGKKCGLYMTINRMSASMF